MIRRRTGSTHVVKTRTYASMMIFVDFSWYSQKRAIEVQNKAKPVMWQLLIFVDFGGKSRGVTGVEYSSI